MICPNCNFEQSDELNNCLRCHIYFAKWQTSSLGSEDDEQPIGTTVFERRRKGSRLRNIRHMISLKRIGAVAILAVLLGYFYLVPVGKGLPIPAEAYRDYPQDFAFIPRDGWSIISNTDYQRYFFRLGENLRQAMLAPVQPGQVYLGLTRTSYYRGKIPPAFHIAVADGPIPHLQDDDLAPAYRLLQEQMMPLVKNYQIKTVETIKVDNLDALKSIASFEITSSGLATEDTMIKINGRWRINPRAQELSHMTQQLSLQWLQVVIPGAEHHYVLTGMADVRDFPYYLSAFDEMVKSFRLLKRPSWARAYWLSS